MRRAGRGDSRWRAGWGAGEALEGGPGLDRAGLPLMKADALDLALVRLETVGRASDRTARAGEEVGAAQVGRGPRDVFVLLGDVVPEIGVVDPTPRASTASRRHDRGRGGRGGGG